MGSGHFGNDVPLWETTLMGNDPDGKRPFWERTFLEWPFWERPLWETAITEHGHFGN